MSAADDPRDPLDEYAQATDPKQRELYYIWKTAIGLQSVDGLETSGFLKEIALKNLSGEISVKKATELVEEYYRNNVCQ